MTGTLEIKLSICDSFLHFVVSLWLLGAACCCQIYVMIFDGGDPYTGYLKHLNMSNTIFDWIPLSAFTRLTVLALEVPDQCIERSQTVFAAPPG